MPDGVRLPLACVPPPASVESAIGQAAAAAATALACALQELGDGGLAAHTKARGAEAIAWLHALQRESAGELDFHAVVRRSGRIALTQRLATVGATADAATLDTIVADVVAIVDGLTAGERAVAN